MGRFFCISGYSFSFFPNESCYYTKQFILPSFCLCNDAFFVGGMRRTLITCFGTDNLLSFLGSLGVLVWYVWCLGRDGSLLLGRCLCIPLLRKREKSCGKLISFVVLWGIWLGKTNKFFREVERSGR